MVKIKQISGIVPKHSSVKDKLPTSAQLETAEIAVNINSESPFISVKCNDGSVKKITADGGYVVVTELPASGKSGVVYALETEIVDPDAGTTYSYDLYIYETGNWRKIGSTTETLQAGENITIVNNRINADQVVDITQADYNDLPASAISSSTLYNIIDKPVLNVDDYQKKLVAGDGITIDAVHNVIDCTLDPDLYIIVDALPAEGIENKIYLLKVVNPDTTVSFNQYGWINDAWVNYGKTSDIQPNTAGSGIVLNDTAINAKIADGLALDANSAITASVGSGLKIDSGKVVPNIAAPLQLNASNQLTVSSSSTYTTTGTELFTRAGAYNLYDAIGKECTLTFTPDSTYVNSSSNAKCFKLSASQNIYFITISIYLKALAANTYAKLGVLKPNGRTIAFAQALSIVNYEYLSACGCGVNTNGLWLASTQPIGNNNRILISGIVYTN